MHKIHSENIECLASGQTLLSSSCSRTHTGMCLHFVMDHTRKYVDRVTTQKIKIFPNQKVWMNSEVHLMLKTRDAAFRSGNQRPSINNRLKITSAPLTLDTCGVQSRPSPTSSHQKLSPQPASVPYLTNSPTYILTLRGATRSPQPELSF